ncbi:MAG: NAD(P)-dependent oxidoreductase [Acidimicrobiia bacterium]|nr:NAD(P)-dependent oxidoreductase [Acidimicrobiia bacterium]
MNRVALSGASGFLGKAVTRQLVSAGVEVNAIVRSTSDTEGLEGTNVLVHGGTTESMVDLFAASRPEVVLHLAALYVKDHSPNDVDHLIAANVAFCAQVAEAAAVTSETKGMVITGTAFQHFESDQYRPLSLYAATKQACEDLAGYYEDAGQLAVARLRIYDVYGPNDDRPKFTKAIHEAQRSGAPLGLPAEDVFMHLIHVDDIARAVIHAAELTLSDPASLRNQAFALRGETALTLAQIVTVWEKASGAPVPVAVGAYELGARSIRQPWQGTVLPGWSPQIDLEDGLRQLLS